MSDRDAPALPQLFPQLFPALRYRPLDYDFESSSRFRVMKSLLALPTPYLTSSDLYPHTGHLADVTYRSPWIRGSMISACSLSLSGSVLNYLKGKTPMDSPERFRITLSQVNEYVDVIPSSNPDSPQLIDQDEFVCLLKESKLNDPCQEIFLKLTADQMTVGGKSKDLLPMEETMLDFLSLFKRHLPTLETKLTRLMVLPIADPLLSLMCDSISEHTIFRHHESFQMPLDLPSSDTCANIHEHFCKRLILKEESLLLHEVLVKSKLTIENQDSICGGVSVAPEQLDEHLPVLDVLHKVSQYAPPECFSKGSAPIGSLLVTDITEPVTLPTEMELEVPVTPNPQLSRAQARLSTSDLRSEDSSPPRQSSLVSARAHSEMEVQLWKAEKHPDFVLGFLLAEPELSTAVVDFQPLYEASNLTKLEGVGDKLQPQMETEVYLCSSLGFTENLLPEVPSEEKKEMLDDFEKLPMEHLEELAFDIGGEIFPQRVSVAIGAHLRPPANGPQPPQTEKYGADPRHTEASSHALQEESDNDPPAHCVGTEQANPPPPFTDKMLSEVVSIFSAGKKDKSETPTDIQPKRILRDSHGGIMAAAPLPRTYPDPLSSFMMLRSQQVSSPGAEETQSSTSPPVPELDKQATQPKLQPPQEQMPKPLRWPTYTSAAVSESVTRETRWSGHMMVQHHVRPDAQLATRDSAANRVVRVQATDSQRMAYCELLAFAQPHLSSAAQLGLSLPEQADFRRLNPDHTHFLLKQQEMSLRRTASQSGEQLRDQELLFNQVALIHVLVTCKDRLLKCDLSAAVDHLSKAAETCAEQRLKPLLRKLLILNHLRRKSQEPDLKLLELQRLVAEWTQSRRAQSTADKILLIMSVESDDNRSIILKVLNQQTVVTAVSPEKNKTKLQGASVVSSVLDSVGVVVYQQHVGPDFPWNIFSLVVECDPLGPSPWASVCRERNISHLSFSAALPDGVDKESRCLEDNVAYVLVVTGGLLDRPLLLQTLESLFNVSVLERSYPPSLQTFGSTRHYTVIAVDESTAIMVQELAELCEERASERVVLRLTALALQYSCCWIILCCPDSRGGGFSSDAFNNLVLVYSSLVLFGMKSEDLDIKVLMVSEVWELAKWISRICFLSLMSSDQDPRSYLDRDWLTVTVSQEEKCLLQFPSINPLVSQLMLRRAPSLQWLLGASVSQLRELLPEVPQKVLKLFSDTTSLYSPTATNQPQTATAETEQHHSPPSSLWTTTADPHPWLSESEPFSGAVFSSETPEGCGFHLEPSAQEDVGFSGYGLSSDVTFLKEDSRSWDGASRTGLAGSVVGRAEDEWAHGVPTNTRADSRYPHTGPQSPMHSFFQLSSSTSTFSATHGGLSLNPNVTPRRRGHTVNSDYGSKCWSGQERKRSVEADGSAHTGVTPLKRGRLSYERVPGRGGGQTRLKLF